MTRKVTVLLDPPTLGRLRELALTERRDVPAQARVLLEQGLAATRPAPATGATTPTATRDEVTR